MVAQNPPNIQQTLRELQSLARLQEDRVAQLEGRLAELEEMLRPKGRNDTAIDPSFVPRRDANGNSPDLASSVLYYGDLISPIDVEWEAEQ